MKLINLFKQGNVECCTYQPRDERAYRVVIRNLHVIIAKDELQSIEFKIRNVTNIRNWKPNNHCQSSSLNKNQARITRKKREIPQCLYICELGTKSTRYKNHSETSTEKKRNSAMS